MTPDRKPLWAAIAFVLLLGTGYGWVELPPGINEPGQAVADWAQTHRDSLAVQGWLVMLAWLPGAALVALVHRRMTGSPAVALLFGGALLAGLVTIGVLVRLALARNSADLEPSMARLLGDLDAYWGPLATIGIVLQASSLAVATRQGTFPRWLLPITTVVALEQLTETLTIVGTHGVLAAGGAFNQMGAVLFFIWIIAQGVAASSQLAPNPKSVLVPAR